MGDPPRPGRPEAAAAVEQARRQATSGARRAARRRSALRALVAGIAGALLLWTGHPIVAGVAFAFGAAMPIIAWGAPRAHARLARVEAKAGRATGNVLAVVLLAPIFYAVFVPFRALARRGHRDTLARRLDGQADSYWRARAGRRPLDRPY